MKLEPKALFALIEADLAEDLTKKYRLVMINADWLRQLLAMAKAAEPFQFRSASDAFQSDDGGCTNALICDSDVQAVRKAFGTSPSGNTSTPHCCHIGCFADAEYEIRHGDRHEDYTHSCLAHLPDLMTDAHRHEVATLPAPSTAATY